MKILITAIFIFVSQFSFAKDKPLYTLFTGDQKGTYTEIANDIKRACTSLDIQIQPTAGSLASINSLILPSPYKAGNRIAFIQQDAVEMLSLEIPKVKKLYNVVTPLYDEEIIVVVNKNSTIRSISDLKNKRVAVGKSGSGSWFSATMFQRLLQSRWITYEVSIEESMLLVLTGQIDAAIVVGGAPLPIFEELGKKMSDRIVMIPIHASELDKIYKTVKMPAKVYVWANYPVETKSTLSMLISASDTNEKEMKEFKSCLVKNLPALRKSGHKKWNQISQHIRLK